MTYDLIIVGAGALGTFHAYHALEKGLKVAVLERSTLPRGASVQNFGQIVPSGMNAKWQAYGRKSLDIYKAIQEKFDISVRQNGSVYLASDEAEMTLLEELAAINRAENYPSHLLTAAQCMERYPGLRSDYCRGGLLFPEEITLEPRRALHDVVHYLTEQKGLHFFPKTLAIDIQTGSTGCTVTASDRRSFVSRQVLVCSGYEFQALFPDTYAQANLQAVKLQMLLLAPQPTQRIAGSILSGLSIRRYESFHACPSFAAIKAQEDPDSLVKKWGVHILFKQATDGSIILGDSHEYAPGTESESLGFDNQTIINDFMMAEAAKIFDLQTWRIQHAWNGMYVQCQDSDIFSHTIAGCIHLLTGIGGKGMTASPGFSQDNLNLITA